VGFSFVGQGRPSYWPFTDRILDFDTLLELEFDSYGPETGTGSWIAGVGYSGRWLSSRLLRWLRRSLCRLLIYKMRALATWEFTIK